MGTGNLMLDKLAAVPQDCKHGVCLMSEPEAWVVLPICLSCIGLLDLSFAFSLGCF